MLEKLLTELSAYQVLEVISHGVEVNTYRFEVRTKWHERYCFSYEFVDLVKLKDPEAFMIESIKADIRMIRREFGLRN